MKKFVLIHSYSDFNKGDAGIVISTVQNLRKAYPSCQVDMISTFSTKDIIFHDQHKEISKYADNIFTSLFPELFLNIGGKRRSSTIAKLTAMVLLSFKSIVNYYSIKFTNKAIIANQDDLDALNAIKECDVVISKGGSFLCSLGSIREDFSLWRMLYPFYIAKLFSKKTVVLAQSLGPFETSLSQKIFNRSLWAIDEIYFREHKSQKLLEKNNIYIPIEKVKFCPDTAFSLDSADGKQIIETSKEAFNVGMTIVDFPFESELLRDNYKSSIKEVINHLIHKYGAWVYIFPQVINSSQFGDEDLKLTKIIYSELSEELKINVKLVEGNFESIDLAKTYGAMDFFLATRLHSSIFSVVQNVPIVNIAYHGTKSEGTFDLLGYSEHVIRITEITPKLLIEKVDVVIGDTPSKKLLLAEKLKIINSDIKTAFISLM